MAGAPREGLAYFFRNEGAVQRRQFAGNRNTAPDQIKSNYRQPQPAATARPSQQEAKPLPWVKPYTCAHCGKSAHHYVSWQKHDHSVAVTCGACKKPRKEAPASSNKAMAAVSAEKAPDMQRVLC